jgi:glycosyltransferase involved in cell wall biosynthesis
VLLFPSLYEGFGWPPLEALSLGCNVVCSSAGALPEVVGDAGLYADPADVNQFAAQALRLLQDEQLAETLLQRGARRTGSDGLQALAEQLQPVYAGIASRRGQA